MSGTPLGSFVGAAPGDTLGAAPNCRFLGPAGCRGEAQASASSPWHQALLPSDTCAGLCGPHDRGCPLTSTHRPPTELVRTPSSQGLSNPHVPCRGQGSLPALLAVTPESCAWSGSAAWSVASGVPARSDTHMGHGGGGLASKTRCWVVVKPTLLPPSAPPLIPRPGCPASHPSSF